ncbi:helix-turn-helix domain-containing protein [Lentzea sp. NEAU-D13]|uniref:Helix-turn-helix domain-containing protein n=1 Tax=Lentzea alba TaxID=2714351 RepID=A0A7C9RWF0_9PSEU|nr:helix-turn-helix transcriptional regulator [Lentzea alba]NGY65131.1 helix-turn-helix domain-containing protein [Lentzea alba]
MSSDAALRDHEASTPDRQTALKEFLRSRRARIKPEDVGLQSSGHRRVPGLRREELAQLAGVSFAYYAQLEQGYSDGVSTSVLDSVARALKLTEDERSHFLRLAQPERPTAPPATAQQLRPEIQNLLDALGVPAFVTGRCMDILGWNRLAATIFGDLGDLPPEERNWPLLMFFSSTTRERFVDLERREQNTVRILRTHHGLYPGDPRLACLVTELSRKSERFRQLWVRHDVGCGNTGPLRMRHPLVGEFDLKTELLMLPNDPDQRLQTYHAEPGSASEKALRVLAEWSDPSGGPAVDGPRDLGQPQT